MCGQHLNSHKSRHHQIPVSVFQKGDKQTIRKIHRTCHTWVHSCFTNMQLRATAWTEIKKFYRQHIPKAPLPLTKFELRKEIKIIRQYGFVEPKLPLSKAPFLSVDCPTCGIYEWQSYCPTNQIKCTICGTLATVKPKQEKIVEDTGVDEIAAIASPISLNRLVQVQPPVLLTTMTNKIQ